MASEPSAVEEYRALIAGLPAGVAGSVELVARQLSPAAQRLLRLGAIPHSVDRAVAKALLPDVDEAALAAAADELRPLSFVIPLGDSHVLHDQVRDYLFGQWLEGHDVDAERWGLFKAANARLERHFARLADSEIGEAQAVARRQRIFHLTGADRLKGFAAFQEMCRSERYRFRLESCEALIMLMREYEPILSANQRSWLDYHEAKLESDLHHHDKAQHRLLSLLERDSVRDDPALRARCLFRLANAYRQLRDFERAATVFAELRDYAAGTPEAADQELRALQGMGALLTEMGQEKEARESLQDAVMLAEQRGEHSEMATAWNALGILYRRFGQPKRALAAFETALGHLEQGGEVFRPRQVYNNIGLLYADRAEWQDARENLERSRDIAQQAGDMNGEAVALSNLGRVYLALGLRGDALEAAERAILLFRTVHNWYGAAMTRRGMARVFRREGRSAEARAALVDASEMFTRAAAGSLAAEAEHEIAKLDGADKSWGWGRWLLACFGGLLAFVVLLLVVAVLLEL